MHGPVDAKAAERRPRRLLFFGEGQRFFYESVPVLNRLAQDFDSEVHWLRRDEPFLVASSPDVNKINEISDKIIVHDAPAPPRRGQNLMSLVETSVKRLLPGMAGEWVLNALPFVLLFALLDGLDLIVARRQARVIFRRIDPDAFLIVRDRNLGQQTALTRLMRRAGRPVIIIPWGYPNTSFMIATRRDSPRNHANGPCASFVQRRQIRNASPHLYPFDGIIYSYYKPGRYLAARWLDVCPSRPWMFGADSDLCCVDSAATARFLQTGGVPGALIKPTGNQLHDNLYQSPEARAKTRAAIAARYNTGGRPILILAVPHLPEHGLVDWDTHRKELRHLMREFERVTGAAVLLSIHPRSKPADYQFLVDEFDAPQLEEPLKAVLNAADMFVCHWSGTTVWGPLIGIPTLVLDYFKVSSLGFEHLLDQVIVVSEKERLSEALAYLKPGAARARSVDLPPFDGRSTERIANAIRERIGLSAQETLICASQ